MTESIGHKRLRNVHDRVNYLCKIFSYDENRKDVMVKSLCNSCTTKGYLDSYLPLHTRRQCYVNCSGVEWICRAKTDANIPNRISWNQAEMMLLDGYSQHIINTVQNVEPRVAMKSMHSFNKELKTLQPGLTNVTHLCEEAIYMAYEPFKLVNDIFPLPPKGEELVDYYVPPVNDNQKYPRITNPDGTEVIINYISGWQKNCKCNNGSHLDSCSSCGVNYKRVTKYIGEVSQPTRPSWGTLFDFLSGEKNAVYSLMTKSLIVYSSADFVKVIKLKQKRIGDPCEMCTLFKTVYPDRYVECIGSKHACETKFRFFDDWPVGMFDMNGYNQAILNCTTREDYGQLLDNVFSMSYIERAFMVKKVIDEDLLLVHPYLSPVTCYYDALLYRYYWPYDLRKINYSDTN